MNKQLERDLKDIIFGLNSLELQSLFKSLESESGVNSTKEYSKNGLKCCECSLKFENFASKGYGRDENEALLNSIKNSLQSMISSNYRIVNIKRALKYTNGNVDSSHSQFSHSKEPLIKNPLSTQKKSRKTQLSNVIPSSNGKKKLIYNFDYNKSIENKENISETINQPIDLDPTSCSKLDLDTSAISIREPRRGKTNMNSQTQIQASSSHCSCIYSEVHQHSKDQIKNLSARIILLEEENQMLKSILLKDFNSEIFRNGKEHVQLQPKN